MSSDEHKTDREKCARAVDILRLHRSDKAADDVVKYVVYLEKTVKHYQEIIEGHGKGLK